MKNGTKLASCVSSLPLNAEIWSIFILHTDYTAQEYFEEYFEREGSHASIAMTCLTYLSFDIFGAGRCDDYNLLLRDSPFLDYAARHWGDHARVQEGGVKSLGLNFLQESSKAACAADVSMVQYSRQRPTKYSGIHVSSFFGLAKIIDYQLKNGAMADLKGRDGKSPLSISAENGHEAIVELLLARDDVDVNSKDRQYGLTPLLWAASNGHEAVVKQFLARDDVNTNSKDSNGRMPLSWAVMCGHEAVVKLFLARDDVDADSKDSNGRTPLLWAVMCG